MFPHPHLAIDTLESGQHHRLARHPLGLLLALGLMVLGQTTAFGQYFPPAVMVSGLNSSPLQLNGGGGSYSSGYYTTYSYTVTVDQGYWDYSQGHWEIQDQGYWDTTPGHWEDHGHIEYGGYYDEFDNWITTETWIESWEWVPEPPIWVPNPVDVWVIDPVWIPVLEDTTITTTAWVSVGLSITSGSTINVSLSAYNDGTGTTDTWIGTYDFGTGTFGGSLPETGAVNTDGTPWTPDGPPPENPSYGPSSVWVDGNVYSWSHTDFTDTSRTAGTDYYDDAAGRAVWVQYASGGSFASAGGKTPSWADWSGTYLNGVFENVTTGVDVRAADNGGNVVYATALTGQPPAIRVDGGAALWRYLGSGYFHHYAGSQPGKRLTIDPSAQTVSIQGDSSGGYWSSGVIWMPAGGRDVRAVSVEGSLWPPDTQPAWGPPDVWVNGTVWRYAGTWSEISTFPYSNPPLLGDHYLGDNSGQFLIVDPDGNVTLANSGTTVTGTYAATAPDFPGGVFTVTGFAIFPGDLNGAYHLSAPANGPPAIWVNGVIFAFSSSTEDPAQVGFWVDNYRDGSGNLVLVRSTDVSGFRANMSLDWSGNYVPASSNPADGGIFVVVNGSPRFDVRASSGTTFFPAYGSPQAGHPLVVKVDGSAWHYAGATGGGNPTDYYFGSGIGERLWIDATNAVSFSDTVNSPNLTGTGVLVDTVFLVDGHDLRACTTDTLPVAPSGTPNWGPRGIWVEGVIWNYIGTVSDETLNVHADFYGGLNAGQIVFVDSSHQVGGAYIGVFDGGVFLINGGIDIRALDASGEFAAPTAPPVNGYPTTLRIGGLHWRYLGSSGGVDYYAAELSGQRLWIDATGAVVYSDRPHNINNATGIFSGGTFTSTGGGASFNAGTIASDLDILGNILSLGSLANDRNTAGLTISFADDIQSNPHKATVQFGASRPNSEWLWTRAVSLTGDQAVLQMKLDGSNRLTLYDPANPGNPAITIDPAGRSRFGGTIRVEPSGDLTMGNFIHEPEQ